MKKSLTKMIMTRRKKNNITTTTTNNAADNYKYEEMDENEIADILQKLNKLQVLHETK